MMRFSCRCYGLHCGSDGVGRVLQAGEHLLNATVAFNNGMLQHVVIICTT